MEYNDISANRRRVVSYVDRLLAANAFVLIYPVWNEGAILKGFLDRVFLPGVSFVKGPDGAMAPALLNINCQIASNRDPLSRPILTPWGRKASAEG